MLHFDKIVFGPIYSRRLGSSLGVNILPQEGKVCNFDCVYCECGWNRDGRTSSRFPTTDEVAEALEIALQKASAESVRIDSITFSGNGEPTLNPEFPSIVDVVLRLRDRFFPQAKVSVLSNATTLDREGVLEALRKIDNPILKIDASSNSLIYKINQPCGSYDIRKVVDSMMKFEGNFILQTMFLHSPDFDTSEEENVREWIEIVKKLRPREVMVYTIDRETPDSRLDKCTVEQMEKLTEPLVKCGISVQVRG